MGYTVVLHKNNSWLEKEKGKVCQKPLSSCTAKQEPVSLLQCQFTRTGSNQSGLLIKWKQIVAPDFFFFFFAVSRSRVLTGERASLKLICWFFFNHTVSFNLGLLNWNGKDESPRAPAQIFEVELQSHSTLSTCQKSCTSLSLSFSRGFQRDGILQPKRLRSLEVY